MDSRQLTILQLLPALESGGVERGVIEVAGAVAQSGHRSLVVSAGGRLVDQLLDEGSEHFAMPVGVKSPVTLRCIPQLRRLLIEERVDVVDIHSRLPGWVTWMTLATMPSAVRPRFISTLHGLHSVNAYSSIMCRGDYVVAVSHAVNNYIRDHYSWVPESRVRVIPRGVDSEEFPRGYYPDAQWEMEFYREFPKLKGQMLVTLPGRVTRLKGHLDLLHSIHQLRKRGLSVHGLIVGDCPSGKTDYLTELKQTIHKLGIEDFVTWIGHRADVKNIYAISRAVVSLSQKPEAFGRTVAESLSIGTPVLGYAHGGVTEILNAQFPQGTIAPGDVNALTDRAEELLTSGHSPFIGSNPFDKRAMLQATLALYEQTARVNSSRAAA